jgi:drug/metabolite transporter (DMT)-like permease
MAKLKRPGSKKAAAPPPTRGLVPCAVIILIGMILMGFLFFYAMKSGGVAK